MYLSILEKKMFLFQMGADRLKQISKKLTRF
jgi:hypothetical protein